MKCLEACPYKNTIIDLKRANESNVTEHKELRKDIVEIKLSQQETNSDIKILRNDVSQAVELIKAVQLDTAELKNKPGKKIDAVSISVISGTVMLIIGALLGAVIKLI